MWDGMGSQGDLTVHTSIAEQERLVTSRTREAFPSIQLPDLCFVDLMPNPLSGRSTLPFPSTTLRQRQSSPPGVWTGCRGTVSSACSCSKCALTSLSARIRGTCSTSGMVFLSRTRYPPRISSQLRYVRNTVSRLSRSWAYRSASWPLGVSATERERSSHPGSFGLGCLQQLGRDGREAVLLHCGSRLEPRHIGQVLYCSRLSGSRWIMRSESSIVRTSGNQHFINDREAGHTASNVPSLQDYILGLLVPALCLAVPALRGVLPGFTGDVTTATLDEPLRLPV